MDSLRNLSTSLPRTTPPTTSPHELLSAFKAAALSVTNLYKTAASDQARTRAEGYQQALDELLTLLDRENLGLGVDGEGWRIRQWATARYNGNGVGQSDDEDEKEEPQQESRHQSPEVQRKQEQQPQQPEPLPVEPVEAERPQVQEEDDVRVEAIPAPHHPDMFTFRSSLPYPSGNHDREVDMESGDSANAQSGTQHPSSMGMNMLPRHRLNRHASHRHSGSHGTTGNRSTNSNPTNLGTGAGSKRKVHDFFDISGFGGFGAGSGGNSGGKDFDRSGAGAKRGRHA